jgi:hypothetical protein
MKFRLAIALLLCFLFSESFAASAHVSRSHVRTLDTSYSSALAAANRFLHAWQTQDHEAGIMMLTDAARQHVSSEKLDEFFSPAPEAAYEIQRGKRLNANEYAFPVVLFGISSGSQLHASRLIIVRTGKSDWAVNRLP